MFSANVIQSVSSNTLLWNKFDKLSVQSFPPKTSVFAYYASEKFLFYHLSQLFFPFAFIQAFCAIQDALDSINCLQNLVFRCTFFAEFPKKMEQL